MKKVLAACVVAVAVIFASGPIAYACGGLVAPNGAVKLLQTTTLVTYHEGVEHYVTSFEYEGGGARFGSIIPLPAVPTSVSRGGSWTLQRLEREVQPPPSFQSSEKVASAASPAQVILRTQVDALDITVVKGGGPAVTAWVRQHGFAVSKDLPAMLDFYARRSPIFLTAVFDPTLEAARGLQTGDGTPVQITMPTRDPWVPLHILSLAKDPDDTVTADVFMLTDRYPTIVSGAGVTLKQSRQAEPSLLNDLRSDRGMGWIPRTGWLSYMTINSSPPNLNYDLAVDASGAGHPSLTAAALLPPAPPLRLPPAGRGWWEFAATALWVAALVAMAVGGANGYLRRRTGVRHWTRSTP